MNRARPPVSAASERSTRRPLLATIVPADPETHLAHCLGRLIRGDRYWPSREARVRKRHGPPLAADAVAKAAFVPPLPTIEPATNWAKLGQFPRWIKLGGATVGTQLGDGRMLGARPMSLHPPNHRPRATAFGTDDGRSALTAGTALHVKGFRTPASH